MVACGDVAWFGTEVPNDTTCTAARPSRSPGMPWSDPPRLWPPEKLEFVPGGQCCCWILTRTPSVRERVTRRESRISFRIAWIPALRRACASCCFHVKQAADARWRKRRKELNRTMSRAASQLVLVQFCVDLPSGSGRYGARASMSTPAYCAYPLVLNFPIPEWSG